MCVCCHGNCGRHYLIMYTSPDDVEVLVNYTMSSFAAVIRTDSDKTVVMATLETLYDVLKPLKALSFPIEEKVVDSLMTSIQDILDNKV